jgi:hypothetical protein
MKDGKREFGTISSVKSGKEDHDILTCSVGVDFSGGHQGFGNLILDEDLIVSFERELCEAFGVRATKELVGKKCFALRCFGHWNDNIEGLESLDTGKRFTLNGWRKRNVKNFEVISPLEQRKKSLHANIEWARRRIADSELELARIDKEYTSWDE